MSDWETIKQECPKLYKNGIVFECGLGWYELIHELSVSIEYILEKIEKDYVEMYAVQVKEKYGILRFYMSSETDEISDLIEMAEKLSHMTCEACGARAKARGKYWNLDKIWPQDIP